MNSISFKELSRLFIASRFILISRICLILLVCVSMQTFASDNSKEILSLSMRNVSIEQVLNEIESQSDYRFLYNKRLIDVDRKVNISINSENVSDVLRNLFNMEEVKFTISDHQIVLSRNESPVSAPQQQGRTVTGVVVDESGELLVGVNITVKGQSTIGTITDMDGKFSLPIPAGNVTLIFSYIGYSSQEVAASTREMRVVLSEDALNLDELVVIGYGVVKKSDVTGSVVSVNSEEMMKRNPTTVALGLQGAAAGVYVGRSGGPDGGTTVRIRGVATINNSTDPLYVVDGIRVGGNIDYLNPNDVTNIEILKDASATAIYGSEGANGVIMITTLKGERGRTRVNFSANYGLQTNSKKLDVMNAEEFALAARQAVKNDNAPLNSVWANYDKELNSIDWQDEMSRTALQQVYNLSVRGGNDASQSVLSVGYMNNEGIIINSNFRRLNVRGNIDHTIKKFLRIGLSTTYMYNEMYSGGGTRGNSFTGLFNDNGLIYYALLPPTMDDVDADGNLVHVPVQYPNGDWGHFPFNTTDINKDTDNPVAATTQSVEAKNKRYGSRIITNAYVELDIIKGLMFRSTGGFNYGGNSNSNYTPLIRRTRTTQTNVEDVLAIQSSHNTQLSLESYLTYNFSLAKIHRLSVMAGHSLSRSYSLNSNLQSAGLPVPTIRRVELTQRPSSLTGTGGLGLELRTQSFFGRANYSLLDRYLLTATVRRDGSSNFGAGNRYGTFPSASLAWRASEEEFIKNLNIFSNLKVRIGWGQTGNAGMPTNRSVDQMSSDNIHFWFVDGANPVLAPGLAQSVLIDKNLKWETNEQTNIGLDFGFANNRYSFSVDYFIRDSKDLLLQRNVRTSLGFNNVYTNAGHIQNKGLEFMGSYQRNGKNWSYNIKVNAGMLQNKVIDIGDPLRATFGYGDHWDNASTTENGYPIASFYAFRVDGIFKSQAEIDEWNAKSPVGYYQTNAQPGDYRYKDLNGNGYFDDNDREIIGNGFPDLDYGINISATYKQWDATLYGYGVTGKKVMSLGYGYLNNMRHSEDGYRNILKEAAKRAWTPENPNSEYPRLSIKDNNLNLRVSDAWFKSADFFRIQNLQVGYNFSKNQLKFANLDNLRIYGSVENLFTFTNYVGNLEPEGGAGNAGINNNNVILLNGFDNGHYPLQRTFTIGLNVGF